MNLVEPRSGAAAIIFSQERSVGSAKPGIIDPGFVVVVPREERIVMVAGLAAPAYACVNFCVIALFWTCCSRGIAVVVSDKSMLREE